MPRRSAAIGQAQSATAGDVNSTTRRLICRRKERERNSRFFTEGRNSVGSALDASGTGGVFTAGSTALIVADPTVFPTTVPFKIRIEDEELRSRLIRFGIAEGSRLECLERIPFGPCMIRHCRQELAIGREVAMKIMVREEAR